MTANSSASLSFDSPEQENERLREENAQLRRLLEILASRLAADDVARALLEEIGGALRADLATVVEAPRWQPGEPAGIGRSPITGRFQPFGRFQPHPIAGAIARRPLIGEPGFTGVPAAG